jgi:hypothetical protein
MYDKIATASLVLSWLTLPSLHLASPPHRLIDTQANHSALICATACLYRQAIPIAINGALREALLARRFGASPRKKLGHFLCAWLLFIAGILRGPPVRHERLRSGLSEPE